MTATLAPRPLTRADFAPFGDVIQAEGAGAKINDGTCVRFNDLARVETDPSGAAGLSVFRAAPRRLPLRIEMLERHPLGSQAFVPLDRREFIVVVASPESESDSDSESGPGAGAARPDLRSLCAFRAAPGQGVNFHRGAWHHPLIALEAASDFLVADRVGPGENCEVFSFPAGAEFLVTG